MCFLANKCGDYFAILILISSYNIAICDNISNVTLNDILRDYAVNDTNNLTHVKTLQMEESGKRVKIFPVTNPIKFKETRDNELSGSSNSRGLLIHDHSDYNINDYEEGPHYEYGNEYQYYDSHHQSHHPHNYEHYGYAPHYYAGHHNYDKGHYYKYPKHDLATKAALWPLAGIALLGAAAALVTNPVLLQLGVISGKRRRRDTEEITGSNFTPDAFDINLEKIIHSESNMETNDVVEDLKQKNAKNNKSFIKDNFTRKVRASKRLKNVSRISNRKKGLLSLPQLSVDSTTYSPNRYDNIYDDDKFVPVPIKLRSPNLSRT